MYLKQLMQAKNRKIVELAKHLGIDPSQTSLFVNGWKKVPAKHHRRVAEFLEVSEERLREGMTNGYK